MSPADPGERPRASEAGQAWAREPPQAREPRTTAQPEPQPEAQPEPLDRGSAAEAAEGRRHRRLFFALWPDETTRGAISRATRRPVRLCGGRPTAKRNLHVTIAFLGALDEAGLERAASVPPIGAGAFELVLDRIGYWRESRVLWLAPALVPPELATLERELWGGLEALGFEREPRAYRPHLTLARRARAVDERVSPIPWPVTALTLVESVPLARGVHYEPLRDWPL